MEQSGLAEAEEWTRFGAAQGDLEDLQQRGAKNASSAEEMSQWLIVLA